MNIEIMRNTLYKAYLDDFYNFCQKLGGATAEIMPDLLAFEADRRAVNITINSIGTELTRDDRRKLYSNFDIPMAMKNLLSVRILTRPVFLICLPLARPVCLTSLVVCPTCLSDLTKTLHDRSYCSVDLSDLLRPPDQHSADCLHHLAETNLCWQPEIIRFTLFNR
ncbi:hypothetical protein ZIOFF_046352 [Zingiber officinale]|uniref:Uncharacterized protein n=1 Tax=Zingiber officinale TaxID=94328 RepID=A0A8J5G9H7_ZINOF|nr:hypothetical protein ZIOFF_046352 [Zingiber officinale]